MHSMDRLARNPLEPVDRREENRRRWSRFSTMGATVTVKSEHATFESIAVDESIGGLGIQTNTTVALAVGQVVQLIHRDAEMTGTVAGVFPDEAGGCRLSISWDNHDSEEVANAKPGKSVHFFRFRGMTVLCEIVGALPQLDGERDNPRQIRLWNGTEFEVQASQIVRRTRDVRRTEIMTMGPAGHLLTQLYELEPSQTPSAEVENILDFEFAERQAKA